MLIFVDGMSHYTDAFLTKKWDVRADTFSQIVQSLTSGRFGAGGITFSTTSTENSTYSQYIQKNYNGVSTIITGIAVRQTTTQTFKGGRLLTFLDSNTTQVALNIMPSGQIKAIRSTDAGQGIFIHEQGNSDAPANITVLGTSVSAISSSSFDFLEVKVVHHPTTGSITIKRNGSDFWTLSNVNTAISGVNQSASVLVGGYLWNLPSRFTDDYRLAAVVSDFHLLNTTVNGSDPNDPVDFIGDRHWETVLPTADSTPLEWTTNGSANHWENVNAINPPSTATDNNTETVGQRDALLYQPFIGPGTASVLISYTMYAQKNTGGAVGVSGLMVSPAGGGGTQGNGTEYQVPSPVAFRQSFLCTDPAAPGTDPITVASANTGGHGYERTS